MHAANWNVMLTLLPQCTHIHNNFIRNFRMTSCHKRSIQTRRRTPFNMEDGSLTNAQINNKVVSKVSVRSIFMRTISTYEVLNVSYDFISKVLTINFVHTKHFQPNSSVNRFVLLSC